MMSKKLDFGEVSDELISIERGLTSFHPYKGKISFNLGIRMSPSEYSALAYQDLLNLYNKIGKIRKTSELIRGVSPVVKTKEIKEAETAIQEISREPSTLTIPAHNIEIKFESMEEPSLTHQEESVFKQSKPEKEFTINVGKSEEKFKTEIIDYNVPVPELGEIEKKEDGKSISPVVFESALREKKKKEEKRIAFEEELIGKELDSEEPKKVVDFPYIVAHVHPEITRFPSIEQDPDSLGLKKYNELISRLESSPEKLSKRELKTQMLALTKQLFREKLTSEREKIKKEIIRLRNILSTTKTTKKMEFRTILESFPNEFDSELWEYLTSMENIIYSSILESKRHFYRALSTLDPEDKQNRKKALELFSSDLTSLEAQASDFSEKTTSFLFKFHTALLKQIKKASTAIEIKMCNNLMLKINKEYKQKFTPVLNGLKSFTEITRIKASHDSGVLVNNKLKPLFDAIDLKEDFLLNYLQSKHKKKYDDYLKKKLSKMGSLTYARKMFLKEKGLSNELLSKYFCESG